MMRSFGKRVDVPGGKRKAVRQRVALTGAAITLGAARSVAISDLAATGARLSGRSLPSDGRQVLLKVGDLTLLGEIVWSGEDDCGVRFDEPVNDAMIATIKAKGSLGELHHSF